jgi:hypothetical protein
MLIMRCRTNIVIFELDAQLEVNKCCQRPTHEIKKPWELVGPILLHWLWKTERYPLDESSIGSTNAMVWIIDETAIDAPHIEADEVVLPIEEWNRFILCLATDAQETHWVPAGERKSNLVPFSKCAIASVIVWVILAEHGEAHFDGCHLRHDKLPDDVPHFFGHTQELQFRFAGWSRSLGRMGRFRPWLLNAGIGKSQDEVFDCGVMRRTTVTVGVLFMA